MAKSVAILGCAPGWQTMRTEGPFDEIWCLNDFYRLDPQALTYATRWFELHGDTPLTRARREPNHFDILAQLTIPVYSFHPLPSVPTAVPFPLDADAFERLRGLGAREPYFTCTLAYQLALALADDATRIALYGTPLIGAREALIERPCVETWLGYAQGLGVKVTICHGEATGLGRHPFLYALQDRDERLATFQAVYRHAVDAREWLIAEASRLGVPRPPEMITTPIGEPDEGSRVH